MRPNKVAIFLSIFLFSTHMLLAGSVYEVTAKYAALAGEWNKVIDDASEWLKEEPDNPIAHLLLYLAYDFTKEYKKSYFEFKILMKNKEYQNKIINWTEDLVRTNPKEPLAYYMLANAYSCMSYGEVDTDEGKEKRKKEIEMLKKTVDLNPKFAKAYSQLAALISAEAFEIEKSSSTEENLKKKYDSLIEESTVFANKAASIEPDSPDTYMALSMVYMAMAKGDSEIAIANAKKAAEITLTPTFYMLLGAVYLKTESYDGAIESIKKAIEIDNQEPYFYSMLSLAYYGKEAYEEAVRVANQAIALSQTRDSLTAYFMLGMSYYKLGQIPEGKRNFQKVIELDPKGELGSMAEFTLMATSPEFIGRMKEAVKSGGAK